MYTVSVYGYIFLSVLPRVNFTLAVEMLSRAIFLSNRGHAIVDFPLWNIARTMNNFSTRTVMICVHVDSDPIVVRNNPELFCQ
jgi:hypothetical protein